jgi:hypothetical protein
VIRPREDEESVHPFRASAILIYALSDRGGRVERRRRGGRKGVSVKPGSTFSPLLCAPISATMESAQVVALAILGAYFGVTAGLFALILRSIPATKDRGQQRNAFKLLTVLSFAHTWYCSSYYDSQPNKSTDVANRYSEFHEGRITDLLS